jgi:hypothetical protein
MATDAILRGVRGDSRDYVAARSEEQDNFRFEFGFSGPTGADNPATLKNYTRARIDSSGKGYFDSGAQAGAQTLRNR